MIRYATGNILQSTADVLVNTVNTVGIMGKGIALAFKKAYPDNYKAYRAAFEEDKLRTGKMFVFKTALFQPRYIVNFPTKKHWRNKSKLEYVSEGLDDLLRLINDLDVKSIAIPPLGCGNGGLQWSVVKRLIIEKLEPISDKIDLIIYEPSYVATVRSVKSVTELTPARAMYLHLIRHYEMLGETATTLIIQKLGYLLQRVGQPLNLRYEKGMYGPYAANLNKMVEALSPVFLTYEGDLSKPDTTISLVTDKKQSTQDYLSNQISSEEKGRLEKVENFIEGFESNFGLELLATVAYAIEQCPPCSKEEIIEEIHAWTDRKKELMTQHMISVSYERVKKFVW